MFSVGNLKLILVVMLLAFVRNVVSLDDFILFLYVFKDVLLFRNCLHMRISCDLVCIVLLFPSDHLLIPYLLPVVFDGQCVFSFQSIKQLICVVDYMNLDWSFLKNLKGPFSHLLFYGIFREILKQNWVLRRVDSGFLQFINALVD